MERIESVGLMTGAVRLSFVNLYKILRKTVEDAGCQRDKCGVFWRGGEGIESWAFLCGKMPSSFAKIGKMVVINSIFFLF